MARWRGSVLVGILGAVALGCGGGGGDPGCEDAEDCMPGEVCEAGTCVPAADAAMMSCGSNADCDDGLFCNGEEVCDPSTATDPSGCRGGDPPCDGSCDETEDSCGGCTDPDADGDGRDAVECGGDDCDDGDANRFPGNPEICDTENHDEDCDPSTFGIRDADVDGEPDGRCCNPDGEGGLTCGTDCDDTRASVSPLAPETCDGLDNDCDEAVDEMVLTTYYADGDGDGHGSMDPDAETMEACMPPPGFSSRNGDCDDADASTNPGTPERCSSDGDEDCDGTVDEDCTCSSGSRGCPQPGACMSGTQDCIGGSWSDCSISPGTESCNESDDDCDGMVDEFLTVTCYADADDDGFAAMGTTASEECPNEARTLVGGCPSNFTNRPPMGAGNVDCGEGDASVFPGAAELCDDIDQNCDGSAAEGTTVTCYADPDRDGFAGDGVMGVERCACGINQTELAPVNLATTDCAPRNADRNPMASELCNAVDDDCNGEVDDGPGFQCEAGDERSCFVAACGTMGTQRCNTTTCQWNDCSADEICNGCDDDGRLGADDTFACEQGTVVTTCMRCGVDGATRTCLDDCSGPDVCRHPNDSACNYCDDDADGAFDEDASTSAAFWPVAGAAGCNERTRSFADASSTCTGTSMDDTNLLRRVLVNDHSEVGGARFIAPSDVILGYGELEISTGTWVRLRADAEAPGDGWAVVVYAGGALANEGNGGIELGVDRTRQGYAAEWRFFRYNSDTMFVAGGGRPDSIGLRTLDGTGGPGTYLPGSANGDPPLDDTTGSCTPDCWLKQNIVLRIRADDPSTTDVNEMYVRMRNGGAQVASCEGDACGRQLTPGTPLQVAVVAATSPGRRAVVTHRLDFTEYARGRVCD